MAEAKDHLRLNGGGPLGAFNKNYMAFTLDEVKRNFKNLITMQPGNFSALATWAPLSFPASLGIGECMKDSGNCEGCAVVTDRGVNFYPRYVNEVNCKSLGNLCGQNNPGTCKATVMTQKFFKDHGAGTCNKDLKLDFYDMKMCCQCILLWCNGKWKLGQVTLPTNQSGLSSTNFCHFLGCNLWQICTVK